MLHEVDSVSERAEAEAYRENLEDTSSSVGEEFEEDIITEEIRTIMERSEREDIIEEARDTYFSRDMKEEEIEANLREEEAKREEEERLAKKEKVNGNFYVCMYF